MNEEESPGLKFSGLFPKDSDIPQYIRDDVMKMELECIEKQKKLEELRNKLELRIRWKSGDKTVFASRSNTLYQLFEIIWHQFQLFNEDDFQSDELDIIQDTKREKSEVLKAIDCEKIVGSTDGDVCSKEKKKVANDDGSVEQHDESKIENMTNQVNHDDGKICKIKIIESFSEEKTEKSLMEEKEMEFDSPGSASIHAVPLTVTNYCKTQNNLIFSAKIAENMRLRLYNASAKTALEAFEATSLYKTLETLNFNSYRPLILETKKSINVFEIYYADGFNILLEEFDLELREFKEIRSVRMPKLGTLTDLKSKDIWKYILLMIFSGVSCGHLKFPTLITIFYCNISQITSLL